MVRSDNDMMCASAVSWRFTLKRVWGFMSVISEFRKWRPEDQEFKASLILHYVEVSR